MNYSAPTRGVETFVIARLNAPVPAVEDTLSYQRHKPCLVRITTSFLLISGCFAKNAGVSCNFSSQIRSGGLHRHRLVAQGFAQPQLIDQLAKVRCDIRCFHCRSETFATTQSFSVSHLSPMRCDQHVLGVFVTKPPMHSALSVAQPGYYFSIRKSRPAALEH